MSVSDHVTDQIVGTLRTMRQEVSIYGVTPEAETLWEHAMKLYRMKREPKQTLIEAQFDSHLPVFLRKQAD